MVIPGSAATVDPNMVVRSTKLTLIPRLKGHPLKRTSVLKPDIRTCSYIRAKFSKMFKIFKFFKEREYANFNK